MFKHLTRPGLITLLASVSFSATSFGANPFITSIYTADPSAHVWADGRLYVYPSRDMDPPRGCDLMDRYHVFSTDNMVDWRDEGEILRASQVLVGQAGRRFHVGAGLRVSRRNILLLFPASERHEMERLLENWRGDERKAGERFQSRRLHRRPWRFRDD